MELHGAGVHFFLPAPFRSAVLEPNLKDDIYDESQLESANLILLVLSV